MELPDEYGIPLPSSVSSSECGEEPRSETHWDHATTAGPKELEKEQWQEQDLEIAQGQNLRQGEGLYGRLDQESVPAEKEGQSKSQHISEPRTPPLQDPLSDESAASNAASLSMPLLDLMSLIEKDSYGKEQNVSLQRYVSGLLRQCGNSSRSFPVRNYLYRRMFECFRTDKKATFASFYDQSLKLEDRASFNSILTPSDLAPDPGPGHDRTDLPLWFTALSSDSRTDSLAFLSSLRNDTSFLAERIASSSSAQLHALVSPHRQALSPESVLDPNTNYSKYDPRNLQRNSSRTTASATGPSSMRNDPLFLFLHAIFDPMSRWNSPERNRQLDVWSSVCARIIEEGKPGSDDLCLVVLDSFAEFTPWTVKPELELFLQDLMQTGQFIVDPQATHRSPSLPVELVDARLAVAHSRFFDKATTDLLDLITKSSTRGVPQAALDLVHATLSKISDSGRRSKALSFFVSRWFCFSFLSNALLFPERHQMLLRCHISAAIRQKIFKELAVRLQKVLFEALSPNNSSINLASKATEAGIERLLSLFEPTADLLINHGTSHGDLQNERPFLMLFSRNILSMAKALYPDLPPDISGFIFKKVPSIVSSVTGSSTLTAGTSESRTGTASSASPSISGTSVTSNTLSSDLSFSHFDKIGNGSRTIETPYKSRPSTPGGIETSTYDDAILGFLPELWNVTSSYSKADHLDSRDQGLVLYICNSDGGLCLSPTSLYVKSRPRKEEFATHGSNSTLAPSTRADLMQAIFKASRYHNSSNGISKVMLSCDPNSIDLMFEHLLAESRSGHDFQSAHFWFRALQQLSQLSAYDKVTLVNDATIEYRQSIHSNKAASDSYQEWLAALQMLQKRQAMTVRQISQQTDALRIKMWYSNDVRHSSTYEDTINVIRALKSMAGPAPQKQTGMAAWARQRLRTSFGQERAHAQVFEALSAPKDRGGPNKLSDTQSELMLAWLNQGSIENFCKGEERIHRFCFEVQKCARRLAGENLLESPVLWSSTLFQRDREEFVQAKQPSASEVSQQHMTWTADYAFMDPPIFPESFKPQPAPRNAGLSFSFGPQASHSIPGPPTEYNGVMKDPGLFSLPTASDNHNNHPRNWVLPPSPISPIMVAELNEAIPESRTLFIENLRQCLTALLVSDLGQSLWSGGSETDHWMNDARNPIYSSTYGSSTSEIDDGYLLSGQGHNDFEERDVFNKSRSHSGKQGLTGDKSPHFKFDEGFKVLLKRFHLSTDPHVKLETLYQISQLAEFSADSAYDLGRLQHSTPLATSQATNGIPQSTIYGIGVPRTRLTRLEEVIANCEERRLLSLGDISTNGSSYNPTTMTQAFASASHVDPRATSVIQSLFLDPEYRPATFFRDLQLIAAFVPSATLDHTAQGAAFWTVGLAAMTLKSETAKLITGQAAEILAHHLNNSNRKEPTRADNTESEHHSTTYAQPPSMTPEELADTTLEDAARLYTLSAMEGDPTAARELALFYLTHPELVRRVMLPLSKPSDVFRSSFVLAGGGGDRDKGKEAEGVLDPSTFAVAFHWMEFAANAGDRDAKTFLRENGDLGRGW